MSSLLEGNSLQPTLIAKEIWSLARTIAGARCPSSETRCSIATTTKVGESVLPTGCVRLLRHLCFEVCTVGKTSLFRSVRGWQANGMQPCSTTPAKRHGLGHRRLMLGAMTEMKSAPGAKTVVPSIHNNNNNDNNNKTETSAYTQRQSGARSGSPQ